MAFFIALAIKTGFLANAIAVFISTPAQPNSMAIDASDAVPTPASIITGTFAYSKMILILYGFIIPKPDPMGEANGIIAMQPISSNFFACIGSSVQ